MRIYGITEMESVRAYSHYLIMEGLLIGLSTIDGHKPQSVGNPQRYITNFRLC